MTRKRTVRRVWSTTIDPISHALYQAAKLTKAEWNAQMVPVVAAVDQLSRGEWCAETLEPIFECLNRIESLLKLAHMPDHGFVDAAKGVMVDALDRQQNTGAKAFKSDELATMREIVSIYGDLLKECSHRTFAEACDHTNANIDRILRTKKKEACVA